MSEQKAIDRRVAREIFALDVVEGEGRWPDYTVEQDGKHRPIPHYCSDLTAAWRVMEWMREQGGTVMLLGGQNEWGWHCFWSSKAANLHVQCHNAVPAMAICLCALAGAPQWAAWER